MPNLKLHIVSFAIPDPPDYGGVIDVFYKIKHLSLAGVKVYLHCSQYDGRQPSAILEKWCEKVWYYPRNTGISGVSFSMPYTVYSRRNDELMHNLEAIDAPVFFDGLTTIYPLYHASLKDRVIILRPQNIEQDYYRLLAERTKHFFKKIYYKIEASLLKRYENKLQDVDAFFTVAKHDRDFFKGKYPQAVHEYIPSFQPYDDVVSMEGSGDYCLYHGNLSVEENEEAAFFLMDQVISNTSVPFIIAGKNPSSLLLEKARQLMHCTVIANPDALQMETLIAQAHVHVLPTFQDTGLKLKLLHALFKGRHVLVNDMMLTGTGLESVCHQAKTANDFMQKIKGLMQTPFGENEILKRRVVLSQHYNNRNNAGRIITFLQQKSL